MKQSTIILGLIIIFFTTSVDGMSIIVLNDTAPQIFALEKISVTGDLKNNALEFTGHGEVVSGSNVKVYLFGPASDVLVDNLRVNDKKTAVSFDRRGYYFLAEEGKLIISGTLNIRTIGQVRLYVPGPLNELHFDIRNGYAVDGDKYGLYDREVVIQRAEKVSTTSSGSFRFTFAERDEFLYMINLKAYGTTLGTYTLPLLNGETVTSVNGAMKSEQGKDKLVLELEGSTAFITVSGTFNSKNIKMPLAEGRHHVLVESDPEKKITIMTDAKEVDLSESTIQSQYSNARSFLAGRYNTINVKVEDLEVAPSTAASVRSAQHIVAITEKGSMIGELVYNYANTGVDYIKLDSPGTPLYAATSRGAVKLTKDDGDMYLSFPKESYGRLDYMYFDSRDSLGFLEKIDVPLANTDLPVTRADTTIYLPSKYIVLKTYGAEGGSELPELKTVLFFALIIGVIAFAYRRDLLFSLAYIIFSVGLLFFDNRLLLLLIALTLIAVARNQLPKKSWVKWIIAGGAVLFAIFILLGAFFGFIWNLGVFNMGGTSSVSSNYESKMAYADVEMAEAPVALVRSMEKIGGGEGAISVPVRKGVLPVKIEIPRLGKTVTVTNYMVTKENPLELSVLVLSSDAKYLLYLVSLAAGLVAAKRRKE